MAAEVKDIRKAGEKEKKAARGDLKGRTANHHQPVPSLKEQKTSGKAIKK